MVMYMPLVVLFVHTFVVVGIKSDSFFYASQSTSWMRKLRVSQSVRNFENTFSTKDIFILPQIKIECFKYQS